LTTTILMAGVSSCIVDPKQEGAMAKKYHVTLTNDERAPWLAMTKRGKVAARQVNRAHILRHAQAGAPDEVMAHALHIGTATVERARKRFVEDGLEAALAERPRPGGRRTLAGTSEAFLIALACSAPPEERPCWTMQLLADKLVELDLVESISDETVRRTLQKTSSSRGRNRNGVCPR
jgi:transposase